MLNARYPLWTIYNGKLEICKINACIKQVPDFFLGCPDSFAVFITSGMLFQALLASLKNIYSTKSDLPNSTSLPLVIAIVVEQSESLVTFLNFSGIFETLLAFHASVIFI